MTFVDLACRFELCKINDLQIDTDGYHGQIIKMIDFSAVAPGIIKSEHQSFDEDEMNDMPMWLSTHGYVSFKQANDTVALRSGQGVRMTVPVPTRLSCARVS